MGRRPLGRPQDAPDAGRSIPRGSPVDALRVRWHTLTLVEQFSIAAAAVVLVGMAAIGLWVADRIKSGITYNTAATDVLHMDNVIAPLVQDLALSDVLSADARLRLDALLTHMIGSRVASIKVWRLDGTVVYSNWRDLEGKRFPLTANFRSALAGIIAAEFEGRPHEGDGKERQQRYPVLQIYAPVHASGSDRIIAVAEYYLIERALASQLQRAAAWSWLVVGVVASLMMSALFGIVRTGSRTIEEQGQRLKLQIGELQTLLEQNRDLRQHIQRAHHRSAIINERFLRRVGADLHDGPAQLVSMALLRIDALKSADGRSDRSADVERTRSALADALREIRAISAGLTLPEIGTASLDEVIRLAVQAHAGRTGTEAACELSLPPVAVPQSVKACAYRFVQEGLNNSFKHAGGHCQRVMATGSETFVVLKVSDLGPGLRAQRSRSDNSGLGLLGLRNRIETMGGQLEFESSCEGSTLTARFNLQEIRRLDANDVDNGQYSRD